MAERSRRGNREKKRARYVGVPESEKNKRNTRVGGFYSIVMVLNEMANFLLDPPMFSISNLLKLITQLICLNSRLMSVHIICM